MTYVLVSLLGDEATELNDCFALEFEKAFPPAIAFHEPLPDHDEVSAAVRAVPNALVFGHDGGGSLRGASTGAPWVTPEQFAEIFADARVWVYACDTRAKKLEDDLESFGRKAHDLGVGVFAGHCAAITAVPLFQTLPETRKTVRDALGRAFRAFLTGENNAGELRRVALRKSGGGRKEMFAPRTVEEVMESLRVLA